MAEVAARGLWERELMGQERKEWVGGCLAAVTWPNKEGTDSLIIYLRENTSKQQRNLISM